MKATAIFALLLILGSTASCSFKSDQSTQLDLLRKELELAKIDAAIARKELESERKKYATHSVGQTTQPQPSLSAEKPNQIKDSSIVAFSTYINDGTDPLPTKDLQALAERLNYDCRGGAGSPFKTQVTCSLRDLTFSYLQEDRDSCYDGSALLPAHQQGWKACKTQREAP